MALNLIIYFRSKTFMFSDNRCYFRYIGALKVSVTSDYQVITGLNTNGRELERLLKLVTAKFQCNTTKPMVHTNL